MTKLKIRKIILLSVDIVLLLACIIQAVLLNKDTTKTFKMSETPDSIIIFNGENQISLVFENDKWYVGEQKEVASTTYVESLITSLSNVRAIDKVGSVKNEVSIEKYQLDEQKCISIVAKKEGDVIRSLQLGKNGADNRQTYGTIDANADIYLFSGSLRSIFDITQDALVEKTEGESDNNDLNVEVSDEMMEQFIELED